MSCPNYYADIEALNLLLQMEFSGDHKDVDLTLDLIDLPFWFSIHSDEKTQTLKAYSQGELYSRDESLSMERGSLILDRETGEGKVTATREIGENMGAFFKACLNLGCYTQEKGLEKHYADLDPEQAGILLTAENGELAWKVVSGKERPDLTVQTLFGGVTTGRPYMDDFWERSKRELMDAEELAQAAEDGDVDAAEELAKAYLNGDEDRGIEQDFEKAFYWTQKMAEAGNVVGMFNLGLYCAKGCGTERDFAKAAEWMEKAAAAGDEDAPPLIEKYRSEAETTRKANAGDAQAMADLAGIL